MGVSTWGTHLSLHIVILFISYMNIQINGALYLHTLYVYSDKRLCCVAQLSSTNANEEGSIQISSGINILHDLITWQVIHLKMCVFDLVCVSGV